MSATRDEYSSIPGAMLGPLEELLGETTYQGAGAKEKSGGQFSQLFATWQLDDNGFTFQETGNQPPPSDGQQALADDSPALAMDVDNFSLVTTPVLLNKPNSDLVATNYSWDAQENSAAAEPAEYADPGLAAATLSEASAAALPNYTLNQIGDYLKQGYWDSNSTYYRSFNMGSSGTGANSGIIYYDYDGYSGSVGGVADSNGLTAARRLLVDDALDYIGEILGINFIHDSTPPSGGVDLYFMDADSGAYSSSSLYSSGNGTSNHRYTDYSWVNIDDGWWGGNDDVNGYTYQTIIHEVGHAIGLGHAGPYNGSANYVTDTSDPDYLNNSNIYLNDCWQQTIMSYFDQTENTSIDADHNYVISWMAGDWEALRDYYGATSAFNGNTTYGFNTNISTAVSEVMADLSTYADEAAFCIIDSDGVDTVDFSGYLVASNIDLKIVSGTSTTGTLSDIGGQIGNMALGVGTVIENAVGGSGNDTISGNTANNVLTGNSGNDTLDGGGIGVSIGTGNDTLYGNSGNDSLDGDDGNDYLYGGTGSDTLYGDAGSDYLYGADDVDGSGDTGTNYLYGGDDNDYLRGGDLVDTLYGGSGDDELRGNSGNDYLDGDSGTDEADYLYATAGVNVNLAAGTASGGDGIDTLVEIENIGGSDYNDTLTGDSTNNVIYGQSGNDTIDAAGGADSTFGGIGDDRIIDADGVNYDDHDGGSGADWIDYSGVTFTNVTINLTTGQTSVSGGNTEAISNFENVDASQGADVIYGTTSGNQLRGNGGNDTLRGSEWADHTVATDHDTLFGGAGDDFMGGHDGNDLMYGEADNDSVIGDGGNDTLYGGTGNDWLVGDYTDQSGNGNDYLFGEDGNDNLEGGTGDDYLSGGNDNDTLLGQDGNDTLYGGSGADSMDGSYGDDVYYVDNVGDYAGEVAGGTDMVYASITWTLHSNLENLGLTGSSAINGTGNSKANEITGNSGNNILSGLSGNDTVAGSSGNDTIDGGSGDDSLDGGDGTDTVTYASAGSAVTVSLATTAAQNTVGAGTDTLANFENLTGSDYGDTLTGDGSNNDIDGGNGNDSITGGAGNDTLLGGVGNDTLIGGLDIDDVDGGAGDDRIIFTAGNYFDNVDGGTGTDTLDASALTSSGYAFDFQAGTITGYSGVQTLVNVEIFQGGSGNDIIISDGTGEYYGNAGNDTMTAGLGLPETLDGGAGIDTLDTTPYGGGYLYVINLITGLTNWTGESFVNFENLVSGSTNDDVTGTSGNNIITTSDGNDTIDAGAGQDTVYAGNGDDTIVDTQSMLASEDDIYDGGAGTDTLVHNLSWVNSVTFDLSSGYAMYGGNRDQLINIENLTVGGSATVIGDANANVLTVNGTGANNIEGRGGNDSIDAGGGSDSINGGSGQDTVDAGDGDDILTDTEGMGASDDDVYDGGTGIDTLVHDLNWGTAVTFDLSAGYATLFGTNRDQLISIENLTVGGYATVIGSDLDNILTVNGTGTNSIDGRGGNDTIHAGGGDDTIDGGTGTDSMLGGVGDDGYTVDNAGDVVTENAGEGNDTVYSSLTWTLGANLENLTLTGAGNINATGNTLNNVLTGNSGNNALNGALGADTMIGGTGNDTYYVNDAGDVVTETADEGTDTVRSSINYTLGANLDNLVLTGGDHINGTGNELNNVFTGNTGNNSLTGGAGNDEFTGGGGTDTLAGGTGDDIYNVSAADTVLMENASEGTDTIQSSITWTLGANLENLVLIGSAVINVTGNSLNNVLTGNTQTNHLNGAAGADTMSGGGGNDTYYVNHTGDVVVEESGKGTDTVRSSIDYTLGAHLEKLVLTGSSDIDGTGNELNNELAGNVGNNVLDGGAGNDKFFGEAGNDTMIGGTGNDLFWVNDAGDVVSENAGEGTDTVNATISHTLAANVERLTLTGSDNLDGTGNILANRITGNDGNNVLTGNDGDDTLIGGLGSDTLIGGQGGDWLTGGDGADQFVFDATPGTSGIERITDFVSGTDEILLEDLIFTSLAGGVTVDMFISGAGLTTAGDADDHLIYNTSNGNLYYDVDGAGGANAVRFALLTTKPALAHDDFSIS